MKVQDINTKLKCVDICREKNFGALNTWGHIERQSVRGKFDATLNPKAEIEFFLPKICGE